MKNAIVALVMVLSVGAAGPASAQNGGQHVAYQNSLLARALPPADKALCDDKAGAAGTPAYDACRVTRLFISDIKADKDQGFPPLTDAKYASKAETNLILDRMTKYGG